MRESSLAYCRCPRTGSPLEIAAVMERDEREIRRASLRSTKGAHEYPVERGVSYLLPEESQIGEVKRREREGWVALAREQEGGGERDRLLAQLPFIDPAIIDRRPHWRQAAMSFPLALALMEAEAPLRGRRVLDLGAWVGWAARRFAEAGAEVVALDFNADPEHGLGKGHFYFGLGSPWFDRVCADAEFLPLADASFDHVFCCATIHHFERPARLLQEIARALKPGGSFVAINEAFRPLLRSERDLFEGAEQTQEHLAHGINEQVFTHEQYRRFIREAGLDFEVFHPRWDLAPGPDGRPRVERGAGLRRTGFAISEGGGSRARRLAKALGAEHALRLPFVSACARPLLYHFTESFRVLVGRKPR